MPISRFSIGQPGVYTSGNVTFLTCFVDGKYGHKPGGGVINGTKTRDTGNATDGSTILRTGLSMAYNAANYDYANWKIGALTANYVGGATTMTVAAATVTELVRRVGASGTFVLTGPSVASTNVSTQQMTVTYSAASGTSITVTGLGANQQDTIRFATASTGGNVQLTVQKTDGTFVTTGSAAWSATDATYLAAINSALDTATGVTGGIVATAISATDTDLGFVLTYSGTGYAGKAWTKAQVALLPTSSTTGWTSVISTAASQGAFLSGSVISESGYSLPVTVVESPPGTIPPSGNLDWPYVPDMGRVDVTALLDYPTDTGFQYWFKTQMSTPTGGKYEFSDDPH